MSKPTDASRDLLFGLLALQNGLIDQGALFAAFAAWTRDKSRPLADHLVDLGHLDAPRRAVVEAIAGLHVQALGGDLGKSLAVLAVGRSTRETLVTRRRPDVEATLGHVGSAQGSTHDDDDPDRTGTYSVGSATSDGQRFRILRPHARGGLGAVFVALDSELDREVALKQILDDRADDPTSRFRFLIEAQITGGLEHPGIVPVYGLGTYGDGRPYYAMRFIRGDSLKEAIDALPRRVQGGAARSRHHGLARPRAPQAAPPIHGRLQRHRVCPLARRAPPRHQAGEYHRGQARRDPGRRLGTGQADRPRRAGNRLGRAAADAVIGQREFRDATRQRPGHPAYMSPEQADGDLERLGPRSTSTAWGRRSTAC